MNEPPPFVLPDGVRAVLYAQFRREDRGEQVYLATHIVTERGTRRLRDQEGFCIDSLLRTNEEASTITWARNEATESMEGSRYFQAHQNKKAMIVIGHFDDPVPPHLASDQDWLTPFWKYFDPIGTLPTGATAVLFSKAPAWQHATAPRRTCISVIHEVTADCSERYRHSRTIELAAGRVLVGDDTETSRRYFNKRGKILTSDTESILIIAPPEAITQHYLDWKATSAELNAYYRGLSEQSTRFTLK